MSSRKSCLFRRISTPSVIMVTVALRLASAISASSPKVSPTPSSASLMPSRLSGVSRVTAHLPLHDDVEVIALVALLDDHLAGAAGRALQALEDRLDVRRRDAMEGVGLQQRRHPVVGAGALQLRLQLLDLVAAGLVPGDHDIEQIAVDRQVADVIDGAHGARRAADSGRGDCAPRGCRRAPWRSTRSLPSAHLDARRSPARRCACRCRPG